MNEYGIEILKGDGIYSEESIATIIANNTKDEGYDYRYALSRDVKLHSEGDIEDIRQFLYQRFPTEPIEIIDYRLLTFQRITKPYFQKVLTTLSRIQKSEDFNVVYSDTKVKSLCTNGFYGFAGVVEWYFGFVLKFLLEEPNGYVVFLNYEGKPKPIIIRAEDVLFEEESQLLVKFNEYYLHITEYFIKVYKCKDDEAHNGYRPVNLYQPSSKTVTLLYTEVTVQRQAVKLGGFPVGTYNHCYESFISGALPNWNVALFEFSDKQAGIKQFMYPERWRYKLGSCQTCQGSGFTSMTFAGEVTTARCHTCKGSGEPAGMFSELVYEPPTNAMQGDVMKPPFAGYIQKDISTIEFIDKDIEQNLFRGLAALNMEFLMDMPLNQSGAAKEMDRQELNAYLYTVTSHIVNNNLYPIITIMGNMMYQEVRGYNAYVTIAVPVNYDVTGGNNYDEKLGIAKANGASRYIINGLEKRLIENKFSSFPDDQNILLLINKLDPFPHFDVSEKAAMLANGTASLQDVTLSNNIYSIINDLYWNTKGEGFMNYVLEKQLSLCYKKVNKILKNVTKISEQHNLEGSVSNGQSSGDSSEEQS